MNLFTKTCVGCGGYVFGPRVGGKAQPERPNPTPILPKKERTK